VSDQSSKRTLETSHESVSGEPTAKKSKKTPPTSAHSNVAVNSKKKTAIDANAPKRANTAFILFSQAERASVKLEHPEASNTDIYKRLGEKWREASAETKAKYEAEYKANKAKADVEMQAYLATSAPTTGGSVASSSNEKAGTAKSKSARSKTPPATQKRGGSAFILFSQAERANIKKECPDVSNAEIFKRLGEKWREASAETKAKYEAEYKANKASVSGSAPPHTQDTVVAEASFHGGCTEPTAITEPVSTPDEPAPASSLSAALLKSKPQQPGGGKARKSKTPAPATMRVSETLLV